MKDGTAGRPAWEAPRLIELATTEWTYGGSGTVMEDDKPARPSEYTNTTGPYGGGS